MFGTELDSIVHADLAIASAEFGAVDGGHSQDLLTLGQSRE